MISRTSKALVAVALAALASGTAWADRGGGHVRGHVTVRVGTPVVGVHHYWGGHRYYPHYGARVFIGPGPFYDPFWYPYGWPYYAPPVVTVPATPPTYIEQVPAPAASGYWYWCNDPQGYYPTVQQCPGGWQPVQPR